MELQVEKLKKGKVSKHLSDASVKVKDAKVLFDNLDTNAYPENIMYYRTGENIPTSARFLPASHFKGIARYNDRMIFTHTEVMPDYYKDGNGTIFHADRTEGGKGIKAPKDNRVASGMAHPCGCQVSGSILAMGQQDHETVRDHSEIKFYDVSSLKNVGGNPHYFTKIDLGKNGSNGVAFTKQIDTKEQPGRYLVASMNGGEIRFYESYESYLDTSTSKEHGQFRMIGVGSMNIENKALSGAGIQFVTQENGDIYIFALDGDEKTAKSKISLFQVTLPSEELKSPTAKVICTPYKIKEISVNDSISVTNFSTKLDGCLDLKAMVVGALVKGIHHVLRTSFRWGKGLHVTSSTEIEVYASDRNVLPYYINNPQIWYFGTQVYKMKK